MVRPSSRQRIVDAALTAFAAAGAAVTIDAVARAAGVTKQGLLYHFADKRDLRAAMLQTILRRWEAAMAEALGLPLADAHCSARIRAYAVIASRGDVVPGEAALFAAVLARPDEAPAYAAWAERWFAPAPDAQPAERARLTTAWLAANGLWSTLTAAKRRLDAEEVAGVLAVIDELTGP